MKTLRPCISVGLAFLSIFMWGVGADSADNSIKSIDLARLNHLIKNSADQKLVVAMAAWCAPCRKELPGLQRLSQKYKNQGLRVVGISLDMDGPRAMQPIVDKLKLDFEIYHTGERAMEAYGIDAIPVMFIVKDGKIVEKVIGYHTEKDIEQKIIDWFYP